MRFRIAQISVVTGLLATFALAVVAQILAFEIPPASPPSLQAQAVGAELRNVVAIAVDASGNLVILDGKSIRTVSNGRLGDATGPIGERDCATRSQAPNGSAAAQVRFEHPAGIAIDTKGGRYIADSLGNRIRKSAPPGWCTVAGTGEPGGTGDGGPATAARLSSPLRVAVDTNGNLYIADNGNARIRKVTAAGTISAIAGTGKAGFSGDGGPGTFAQIDTVSGLGVDADGNVYIADTGNARIRKLTAGGIINTIAGTGGPGFSGDGGPAARAQIDALNLAVDAAGNVFVVGSNRIRKIGTDGVIRTVAGTGTPGFAGDGGPATDAQLNGPSAVAVDAKGNLYIADTLNGRIRKVDAEGKVSTTPAVPYTTTTNPGRPARIHSYMNSVAGYAVSIDCGHVQREEQAAIVVSCVEKAISEKATFIASFAQPGGEAQIVGLVSKGVDVNLTLYNDGRPAGGRPCARPKLAVTGTVVRIDCGP
jgi:sugar lactone lactonase YvrE